MESTTTPKGGVVSESSDLELKHLAHTSDSLIQSMERGGSASSDTAQEKGSMNKLFLPLCVLVIVAGTATGAGLSKLRASDQTADTYKGQAIQQVAGTEIKNGQVFGSPNEKDFKDSAEGYLEVGGVDGEGSHKLLREGGISQTVFLTSSVTDLDKFQGMRVKVWGETFKAQKAGWLMDVGRVQIVDVKAQQPTEE